MTYKILASTGLSILLTTGCASISEDHTTSLRPGSDWQAEVIATEKAFAKTMARRDIAAFSSFLADDAIFMSGDKPLRGKKRITENWRRYFSSAEAPFSWHPERVEVVESAGLALSTGPVLSPDKKVLGDFASVWRRKAGGQWEVIFDKGGCACDGK